MFYPVHFETRTSPGLQLIGRKRPACDLLLTPLRGCLLLRLGRTEHWLQQGEMFWLPADCLHGLTLWQGCHLARVHFSMRVTGARPQQAGFVRPHPLLSPLLSRLDQLLPEQMEPDWQGPTGRLLRVIGDLLPELEVSREPMLSLPAALSSVLDALPASAAQWLAPELAQTIRETFGCEPDDWLRQWQLHQALQGIRQGHSEEQAALQAGFASFADYQRNVQQYLK